MQLIHGDCLQEMKKIPDHSVDLILADLPYGTTACSWDIVIPFEPLWEQYKRVIKKAGVIALHAATRFNYIVYNSNSSWFRYDWVWDKKIPSGMSYAKFQPMRQHEFVLIFSKGKELYNPQMVDRVIPITEGGKKRSDSAPVGNFDDMGGKVYTKKFPISILTFDKVRGSFNEENCSIHPTQKPTALLEYLIKTYTNEGDLVLDNCMGSGSTGIACLNTNRDFIGIELYPLPDKPISKTNPDYFGIAQRRIAKWKFEPADDPTSEKINLF